MLELIKYDHVNINYHQGKANVVTDALSQKATGQLNQLLTAQSRGNEKIRPRGGNTWHESMLRCYIRDPSHVFEQQPIELQEDLIYKEKPVHILDIQEI